MKKVALHNLGCKVNAYEIEVMQQMLQKSNYEIVPFDNRADVYIVNTCTVTNIADRKSRQMLHRARKLNPAATVVAVGCYAQTDTRAALEDASVDLLVGNNHKKDLVAILEEYERAKEEGALTGEELKTLGGKTVADLSGEKQYEELELTATAEHTRAYIKIQDGCDQFCSYCIIPYARGRVRSRPAEDIIKEIEGLAKKGYKEMVLTGIHLSSYGVDLEDLGEWEEGPELYRNFTTQQRSLLQLLEKIEKVEGIGRIRLGSLEPGVITEEFAGELSRIEKLCPHFHLSLQSGCDETLRRMNRRYTAGQYYEKTEILRSCYDRPAITTDVIVGFPGETEEEFFSTYRFLEQIKFYEMHVFKYSRRRGTRADRMEGQVEEAVKTARSAELLKMTKEHSRDYRQALIGREAILLTEERMTAGGREYLTGYTREYVRAAVPAGAGEENQLIKGTAEGFLTEDTLLLGNVEEKNALNFSGN